jgi:hypothetical protein
MKTIINSVLLFFAVMTMSSCSDNNDNSVYSDPSVINGLWYAEVPMTGQTYDMRSHDDLVEVTYDHVAVVLDLQNGFGTWTHYYIKDGEMVNYEGHYFSSFSYTIDGEGNITLTEESDISDTSAILGIRLRYAEHKITVAGNISLTLTAPFDEAARKTEQWNELIDKDHLGWDADEYETELSPKPATEPSRARRQH